MKYSKEEVLQYILEEDVKFIRLAFCDAWGKQKNISILPGELSRAFQDGIAIDASALAGFKENAFDLFLHPDAGTLSVLPWRPEHGRVVRMFCDMTRSDGAPFEGDARFLLKQTIARAKAAGLSFDFATEMEFYLFQLDENGKPTKQPYDEAGYLDIAPEDKGENVRREICLTLEQMGICPESSHHERGPGQNEIDFRYADALSAADGAITFAAVVRTIAARNGLFADFSPKPLSNQPGNGCHIHLSVAGGGEDALPQMMAGILSKMKEMTLFFNPIAASYQRLGDEKAPAYLSWCHENRNQWMRIPTSTRAHARAELCSPDAMLNPYLAFALLMEAGMLGISQAMQLPPSADLQCKQAPAETLPASLEEAIALAEKSDFIKAHVPPAVRRVYCRK